MRRERERVGAQAAYEVGVGLRERPLLFLSNKERRHHHMHDANPSGGLRPVFRADIATPRFSLLAASRFERWEDDAHVCLDTLHGVDAKTPAALTCRRHFPGSVRRPLDAVLALLPAALREALNEGTSPGLTKQVCRG